MLPTPSWSFFLQEVQCVQYVLSKLQSDNNDVTYVELVLILQEVRVVQYDLSQNLNQ